jgi:hypothetical protein
MTGGWMQGGEVGWDPISIEYRLPWSIRFFVIYCALVLIIALATTLRLAPHLWLFPNRELTRCRRSSGQVSPGPILTAGFASNFREILKLEVGRILSPLRRTEAEFIYLWQIYLLRAKSIIRLAALTFMVSVCVFLMRSIENFSYFGTQKISSFTMISGSIVENLTVLELGTVVLIILYGQYSILESALRRRQAAWDFVLKTSERNAGDLR